METFSDMTTVVLYAAAIAALAFFVHKVLWLVQYKRIQQSIVGDAVRRLREGNVTDLAEWEEFARRCWSNALNYADIHSGSTFIHRVEEGFAQVQRDLRAPHPSVAELLRQGLSSGKGAPGGAPVTLVSLRRLTRKSSRVDERYEVALDLRYRAVPPPRPPDRKLYELTVKSRYGLLRRALVFFSGIADVVYSSQHVALMSQNVHVPTSVLLRRLSLVLMVLCVLLVDLIFHVRRAITNAVEAWLFPVHQAGHGVRVPPADPGLVSTVLGFGAWIAIYGSLYLVLFFAIRRRYDVSIRRLRMMEAGEARTMQDIHHHHLADLSRWGAEYGRMLDNAVEITRRHSETLLDHYSHRLRRRVASAALVDTAKTIADCLFRKLPESRGELQDAATTHRHSLAHYVWPRAEEMGYQVVLAQYRAAWKELEHAVAELRREQPDPSVAHEVWRSTTLYALVFTALVPSGTADGLRQAYAQMVTDCVAQTDQDLGELDRRLGELHRSLAEQFVSARALVESRVELSGSQMQAAVDRFSAEIIRVREQARLEAMAFEI